MKKYAVVNSNGIVDNIILWDESSQWQPPEGSIIVKIEENLCDIGWKHNNGEFIKPDLPEEITPEQNTTV